MQLTENAINVLKKRYLEKNEDGEVVETPQDMFGRVAQYIGQADSLYGEDADPFISDAYDMMANLDFLPNTPCLANAGRKNSTGQLAACFVLPIEDSMVSIMETLKNTALIHQSGGGTGFSFSKLRPAGDFVKSSTGVASGPISFMKMYNNVTDCVKQSGIRRGANMGILRVDHPDILQFITCKQDMQEITNFNISVGITDAFMEALGEDRDYALINPRTGKEVGRLSATLVWDKIVKNAWYNGDPGLFFIDRVNALDPLTEVLGPIEATNPCGEVPLRAYDACTLGSINVGNFVQFRADGDASIDWTRLATTVHSAVHFLDNVLTVNKYPVKEIDRMTQVSRKIGLGVMGWADALIKMNVPYESRRALELADQVMRDINAKAVQASEVLAEKRGAFLAWDGSKWQKAGDRPRRNSTVTVIAPTGSISIIAGCSSGIEPIFAISYERNQAGMKMQETHPLFADRIRQHLNGTSESVLAHVLQTGSCQDVEDLPERMRSVFKTASEIDTKWHVLMQAAFQKHVEDGVSKTINMPNSASEEDVRNAYRLAWSLGCKGITVYRDGCRPEQVLSTSPVAAAPETTPSRWGWRRIPKEDGERQGKTITKDTAFGSLHTTINRHPSDDQPFECFGALGKGGAEVTAFAAALGRASSLLLQIPSELSPTERLTMLAKQLLGLSGTQHGIGEQRVESVPDAMAKAIIQFLAKEGVTTDTKLTRDVCPDCHKATLVKGGKCDLCESCGYSKC